MFSLAAFKSLMMDGTISWEGAFRKFKIALFFLATAVVLITDILDIIFFLQSQAQIYINIIEMSVVGMNLLLYLVYRYRLNIANAVLIYAILFGLYTTPLTQLTLPHIDGVFLRLTIIAMASVTMAAFLINKKHAIPIIIFHVIYALVIYKVAHNDYLQENFIVLFIISTTYMIAMYFLMDILETSYLKQWELISQMEEKNEELVSQAEELQVLNDTKAKMISVISHDLRSPCSSMKGISEFLMKSIDQADEEKSRNFARVLNSGLNDSYNLLENLLSWAKSQTGGLQMNRQGVNVRELVDSSVESLRVTIEKKQIELVNRVEEDMIGWFDPAMISTVVRNIVSNALKFTQRDGRVTISCKRLTDELVFTISDNGVGMQEEVRSRLFTGDQNQTTQGTEKESGAGLGLVICQGMVESHGGKIWVESIPGKGSDFSFSIPLKKE